MEREVMEAIYHAFQHWMLCACLAGLGMIAALLFLAKVAAPAWDAVRRWWSLPCIQRVIVGVCVVGLSYYGATKQGWHIGYDGGIKAGATANVVTNDTVSIHWQRDTSGGVYVPETATVYIDAIEHGSSNVVNIAQTTVGAWGWSGNVENATNYDYIVWAYYIPPEPVHTNGVWTYKTHFDRNGEYALPLRARVEVNGRAISTPVAKRATITADRYIQDGLVAQWDAKENVGYGDHDPNAAKWKDLTGKAFDFDVPSTLFWSDDALVFPPNGDKNTNRLYTNHSFTQNKTIEVVAKFTTNSSSILRANTSGHTLVFHWGFSLFWNGTNRGNSNLSAGQRHYAALCIDDANGYRIYRDTANVHRNTSVVLSPLNETVFTVGYYPNSTYAFYGDVCAIRFYNRPLTAEEIAHNYEIDKERFNLP